MEVDFSLRTLPSNSELTSARLRHASSEIESLFVSMMLKELRESGGEDGLFAGDASDTLGGLFDQFFGKFIADQGGIGLADQLISQISNEPEVQAKSP